ncbi:hypothetical protein GIB67_003110 [Kingdonia uniflora]|uniref:Uncharacterized protein n=1 Tax=Kingdonia uniflora TaxID=39325 RepID=A0A7J7N6B0_9MAGN|nr:hypothetical protein GIB67_003110 [Kingdonia uniflora]
MEVQIPVSPMDFNFDSACSSPYISAPTSPKRFGDLYFSAPTSPTSASAFYDDFNRSLMGNTRGVSTSSVPFDWEEIPGTPKSNKDGDDDFEFDFSGQFDRLSLSADADELFDGGKIKPLKPPPGSMMPQSRKTTPVSQGKKKVFSPKQRKQIDPFAVAIEKTETQERGRERGLHSSSSRSRGRRETRSVSPLKDSEFIYPKKQYQQHQSTKHTSSSSKESSTKPTTSASYFMSYRKWKLKDFLLFRSASEGRGTNKDPFRKFSALSKRSHHHHEDVKNSSFRSTDSSGSMRKKAGPVSAHELHYTANRANSEELRKKTFLPYKQGVFGCLGFNPAVKGFAKNFHI